MIEDLHTLVRFNFRLKRSYFTAWLIPLLALVAIFPPVYYDYYPTLESRQEVLESMSLNAGVIALYGHPGEPGHVGQVVTWELGMWLPLLGSVMAVLLVVSLHRAGEASGRTELQRSTGLHAVAPALAASMTAILSGLMLGALTAAVLILQQAFIPDLYFEGALGLGATVALATSGSALIAQLLLILVASASSLTLTGLLTVTVLYMMRVWADVREVEWLNWLTPLGWRVRIDAYTEDDWGSALICLGVVAVLLVLVTAAEHRRSYGEALISFASRRTRKIRAPRGVVGLTMRLARGSMVGWVIAVAVLSAFLMSMSGSIQEIVAAPDASAEVFRDILGGSAAYELFIGYIAQAIAILISAAAVGLVAAQRSAEDDRTVDLIRSTGVRRWTPLTAVVVTALAGTAVLVATLIAAGALGLWSQDSTTSEDYITLLWAGASQLAPTWLFVGITSCVIGARPTWSTVPWLLLGISAFIALLGELLGLPQWAIDLSPFTHSMLNVESDAGPLLLMLGLGGFLTLSGVFLSSIRDVR